MSDRKPKKAYFIQQVWRNVASFTVYADNYEDAKRRVRDGDYENVETELAALDDAAPAIRKQERQRVREALQTHWLAQIECDHEAKQDRPICGCSEVDLGWHPSIGAAVKVWIDHLFAALDSLEDDDG